MNCDYLKDPIGPHTRKLQFLSSVYQLEQLISEPTRVTDKSTTLIDLAFTNDTNNIGKYGVIYNGMSDHNIIYIMQNLVPLKRQEIKKETRNLKYFEADHFFMICQIYHVKLLKILITQIWLGRFGKQILIQF